MTSSLPRMLASTAILISLLVASGTAGAHNLIATATAPAGGLTTYSYDPVGNLAAATLPNGTQAIALHDALRAVEGDGRTVDYAYDAAGRLLEERIADPVAGDETISYSYDAAGNRLSRTDSAPTVQYVYDANDRLTAAGPVVFTYDANGNTLSRAEGGAVTTYGYDFEDRLVTVHTPDSAITYEYDADGLGVSTAVGGVLTRFLVDKNRRFAQVLEERAASGQLLASYVHGLALIRQDRGGTASFYHHDGLGSVRALTDLAGNVTDTYTYEAFGELVGSTGSTANPHLFTGERRDAATGLDYLRARYLDPRTGRFLTVDPFAGERDQPETLHRYAYAAGDPVNATDPTGKFTFSLPGITISINIQGNLRSTEGVVSRAALQRARQKLSHVVTRSVREMRRFRLPGQETHHLIEQRLWTRSPELRSIFKSVDEMPGINLSRPVHQIFTNAWRRLLPYSNQAGYVVRPTLEEIMRAATVVYAKHPLLLRSIFLALL